MREPTERSPSVEFDVNGCYYVICPDCEDARDDFEDRHPKDEVCVECKLCRGTGDLCVTMLIAKTDTTALLEEKLEHRRREIAAGAR